MLGFGHMWNMEISLHWKMLEFGCTGNEKINKQLEEWCTKFGN
jgi:hypothetical protein